MLTRKQLDAIEQAIGHLAAIEQHRRAYNVCVIAGQINARGLGLADLGFAKTDLDEVLFEHELEASKAAAGIATAEQSTAWLPREEREPIGESA